MRKELFIQAEEACDQRVSNFFTTRCSDRKQWRNASKGLSRKKVTVCISLAAKLSTTMSGTLESGNTTPMSPSSENHLIGEMNQITQ